jgi:spore coat polysaccharide biosynthesis protein SpsF (cytidylyltransferase family)
VYLEVDEPVDFEVLKQVIDALYPVNPAFTTEDILAYLDAHPGLADRNRFVERRWKAFQT